MFCITKPLEMDDFTFPQELDWVANIGVVDESENVVVGDSRLLLCGEVLVKIG